MRTTPLLIALLVGCNGDPDPTHTGTDPSDTSDSSPDDTGPDTDDTAPAGDPISDVSWAVHEEIGSIVVVSWEQAIAGDVHIEYGLDGEDWHSSPATAREVGPQEELLLGIPYDAALSFRLVSGDYTSEDTAAQTDPLHERVPVPTLEASDASAWVATDRWLLVGLSTGGEGWDAGEFWKLILDRQGRVVWAHETPMRRWTFYMQPSLDGASILWDENTFWTDWDSGAGSTVHRMTIDGAISESISLPGLHHAFIELPDGAILWGGLDGEREILRERSPDGSVREIWDCTAYWTASGEHECDGNALFWNEAADTVYFSSDIGNSVAEIDRQSGDVLRVWGQLEGAWGFADPTTTFWKQHSPTLTPEGNLMVSTWAAADDRELRAREYEIDDEAQVLREVWSCGAGSGIEGDAAGEAHRLSNGNTLLNYGLGGAVLEYTPDCTVVWHVGWYTNNLVGRAVFLDDLYDLAP